MKTPSQKLITSTLREEGIFFIQGVHKKEECKLFVRHAEKIIEKFIEQKKFYIHEECQYILNPFRHDPIFFNLFNSKIIDDTLRELIDENYVLINSTVLNRRVRADIRTGYAKSLGDDWHSDSRYLDGKRLDKGFGYLAIHMFEDFKIENGATHYVPLSHKRRDIPERRGNYEYNYIEGEAGTVVIMDSGMWHRSGPASSISRWSAFNLFGPWFMKPYYRFPEFVDLAMIKKINPTLQRLLHFTSTPPLNEDERLNTLVKDPEV